MKRTKLSKLTAIILMLAMIFSLSACGGTKDGAKTEDGKNQASGKIEFSDDYQRGTFSIDGKVFKLHETTVKDVQEAGFEITYKEEDEIVEGYSFGRAEIVLPENTSNNNIALIVSPEEDINIMDDKAIIDSIYFRSDDIRDPAMPEVIVGAMKLNDFTTMEDVKAKYGTSAEIEENNGALLLEMKSEDGNRRLKFTKRTKGDYALTVFYSCFEE